MGLLAIPRATVRGAQFSHDLEQADQILRLSFHSGWATIRHNRAMAKRIQAMKPFAVFLFTALAVAATMAAELIPKLTVDGKVYYDVRWGPVNQGKVVIFHSRGNAVVPLSSLPPEYQAVLGYHPLPPAPAAGGTNASVFPRQDPAAVTPVAPPAMVSASSGQGREWEEYHRERGSKLVLNNQLVDRSELQCLVGFVGNPVRIYNDKVKVSGVLLELAERRTDVVQPAHELVLRPNLWQRTGKVVLLRNYKIEGEVGMLVRVFAVPAEDVEIYNSYIVATEPTFEQWKQLRQTAVPTLQ